MSERGVFAVDRGIWDHDLFFDGEPFSRREAWLWLVSEAAWKERSRRIVGRQIQLQRGQLVASLRFIASKWGWSEPRVRRFLSALVSEQMIDAKTDAGVTVITICKYDEYQRVSLPSDAMRETDVDAAATQDRRSSDAAATQNKDIENIKQNAAGAAPDPEVELFRRGREVLGRQAGGLITKLLAAKQKNIALARAAIEQASTKSDPREYIGAVIRGREKQSDFQWNGGMEGII